jgi:hypothetical protein
LTALTDLTTPIDETATPHDAVMWTVSQIAERDGISKQAVSTRARGFAENHSLTVDRDGRGRIKRLNVVEYDALRDRFGDASKAQAPRPTLTAGPAKPPQGDSREEAQRRQAWIDAERSRIALDELKGELLRKDVTLSALAEAADRVAGIIDRLQNAADDLAPTVAQDGTHGLRLALAKVSHTMRKEIAEVLRNALLGLAPAQADPQSEPQHETEIGEGGATEVAAS